MKQGITRRQFLAGIAMTSAAAALSSCTTLPGGSRGSAGPRRTLNDKIQMGFIGVGWQGNSNLDAFLNIPECRVLAIADVDAGNLEGTVNRVNGHYQNKDCRVYKDFRELFARGDLDAVSLAIPDHWHAILSISALRTQATILRHFAS